MPVPPPELSLPYQVLNPAQVGRATHLLLHGVGANETSLAAVGRELADPALVLAVRAPLTLGPGAYGFFQVSFATGRPVYDAAQEQQSRQQLLNFIGEARRQYGLTAAQVYLLGFSQGATVAYSASLTGPEAIGGVLAYGGRVLPELARQLAPPAQLRQVRFFVRHGTHDPVLPLAYAEQAVAFARQQGIAVYYEAFAGGHELPPGSWAAARRWLYAPAAQPVSPAVAPQQAPFRP